MNFRKALKSNSVKDFSSLFFSNILQKVFGLVREPVVAFFLVPISYTQIIYY